MSTNTQDLFFELVRAGLWEQASANHNLDLNFNDKVDWEEVYQLAEEQSVIGLVLAGIERYKNLNDNGGGSQLGLGSTLRLELP